MKKFATGLLLLLSISSFGASQTSFKNVKGNAEIAFTCLDEACVDIQISEKMPKDSEMVKVAIFKKKRLDLLLKTSKARTIGYFQQLGDKDDEELITRFISPAHWPILVIEVVMDSVMAVAITPFNIVKKIKGDKAKKMLNDEDLNGEVILKNSKYKEVRKFILTSIDQEKSPSIGERYKCNYSFVDVVCIDRVYKDFEYFYGPKDRRYVGFFD